ncbi:hypothetical protein [Brevundimonas lenta]|uniref:Uncharacterized protein n=1 Tax=Brevundimonas lenta TaxID=424796 RepID=A0A7W6NPD3_9CAUL|nr:hypothetical protein [Brevundimonas lenta]MBB4082773.1 hypothetical protein [Brevundimonas lenta]
MAEQPKATDWNMIVWVGVSDIVVGAGLVVAAYTDMFGEGLQILALVGGVMALAGVGIVVFGRHKLSQAEAGHGDLN